MAFAVDDSHFQVSDESLLPISTAQSLQLAVPFITSAMKRSFYSDQLFESILNIPFDESHLIAVESLRSLLLKNVLLRKTDQLSLVLSKNSRIDVDLILYSVYLIRLSNEQGIGHCVDSVMLRS